MESLLVPILSFFAACAGALTVLEVARFARYRAVFADNERFLAAYETAALEAALDDELALVERT